MTNDVFTTPEDNLMRELYLSGVEYLTRDGYNISESHKHIVLRSDEPTYVDDPAQRRYNIFISKNGSLGSVIGVIDNFLLPNFPERTMVCLKERYGSRRDLNMI